MKKWGIIAAMLVFGILGVFMLSRGRTAPPETLSDVTPMLTGTLSPTSTATNTVTATVTFTATATDTPTATLTLTPSNTETLSTRVLRITAIAPDLVISETLTPTLADTATAFPTQTISPPPATIALAVTDAPFPGWIRYETADPAFRYSGRWMPQQAARASQGGYSYSSESDARASLSFDGAAFRVRYVASASGGIFAVRVDGQIVTQIDSYRAQPEFLVSEIFALSPGQHTLDILNTGRKNPVSRGNVIALDNVEVYRAPTSTPTQTFTPTATRTATLTPAPAKVELIAGPATTQPTVTPAPPSVVAVSLIIAYDENGNRSVDPSEGVQGISVRLVTVGTNEVIASGSTNSEGFVRLEALSNVPLRLVVPYFGKFWNVSAGSRGESSFSLLIPPANVPGLIP